MGITTQLAQQSARMERRIDDLSLPEASEDLISPFLALPGLRGFWSMGSFDNVADARDMSGQGRTLTDNGNPEYNYYRLAPYIDLDGNNDFLFRTDEAALSIRGTESYVAAAARGLTLGGWFWYDVAPAQAGLVTKWNATGNQRSYRLWSDNVGNILLGISVNGIAEASVASVTIPSASAWYFLVGKFIPNAELAVFVNDEKTVGGVPPASIFDSTAQFQVGSIHGSTDWLNGRASLCFLCAIANSDAIISSLFEETRGAFRV